MTVLLHHHHHHHHRHIRLIKGSQTANQTSHIQLHVCATAFVMIFPKLISEVRQECLLSQILLAVAMDRVIRRAMETAGVKSVQEKSLQIWSSLMIWGPDG